MADPDVAHEAKDIIQRRIYTTLGDGLFERFGLDLPPIVGQLPADLPVLEVRSQYADLLYELANGTLADLEMQSSYVAEDVLRFGDYNWASFRRHRRQTHTIVIYGPAVTSEPPAVVEGGGHTFRLTNILLAKQDGDAALRRLQGRVTQGEALTAVDRVDLALMALLPHQRPLEEVVAATLPVVRTLPEDEQAETVGTIIGLGYHYLDQGVAAALLEAFKMVNAFEELVAEWLVKGRQEGQAEGKRIALRRLLERRFGTLPERLDHRIALADEATLDSLFDQAITTGALTDL